MKIDGVEFQVLYIIRQTISQNRIVAVANPHIIGQSEKCARQLKSAQSSDAAFGPTLFATIRILSVFR